MASYVAAAVAAALKWESLGKVEFDGVVTMAAMQLVMESGNCFA